MVFYYRLVCTSSQVCKRNQDTLSANIISKTNQLETNKEHIGSVVEGSPEESLVQALQETLEQDTLSST